MDKPTEGFPFRIDAAIGESLNFSVSGFLPQDAAIESMDKQVDTLIAVVERQRAKFQIAQWMADLDAKKRVLQQERERLAKQHAEADRTEKPSDYMAQAITASRQNIERMEKDIVGGQAAIDGLTPKLRLNGAAAE